MASLATPERRSEARVMKEAASGSKRRSRPVKRKSAEHQSEDNSKRKRTFDDFFNFCSFVLAYEEELERQAMANGDTPLTPHPPPSTNTSLTHHTSSSSSGSSDSGEGEEGMCDGEGGEEVGKSEGDGVALTPPPDFKHDRLEYTSEDESWNLVTCFCRRPFAGRPMIECSHCGTWVHLFCAKIRKDEVPDVYFCPSCHSHRGGEGRERGGRKGRRRTSKDS